MRRKDQWDDLADYIVFEDPKFRKGLESGDDALLSERIALAIREHLCIDAPPSVPARAEVRRLAGGLLTRIKQPNDSRAEPPDHGEAAGNEQSDD